jgi:hypothetical protein
VALFAATQNELMFVFRATLARRKALTPPEQVEAHLKINRDILQHLRKDEQAVV